MKIHSYLYFVVVLLLLKPAMLFSQNIEMRFCKELARHHINPPIPPDLLPEVNDNGSLTIIPKRHEKLKKYIKETHLVNFEIPRTSFMSTTSNSSRPTPDNQTDPASIEK